MLGGGAKRSAEVAVIDTHLDAALPMVGQCSLMLSNPR
jgi:hypothetical protein